MINIELTDGEWCMITLCIEYRLHHDTKCHYDAYNTLLKRLKTEMTKLNLKRRALKIKRK